MAAGRGGQHSVGPPSPTPANSARSPLISPDRALIDRDPFDPGSGPIGDARVELTVASGRVVYQR